MKSAYIKNNVTWYTKDLLNRIDRMNNQLARRNKPGALYAWLDFPFTYFAYAVLKAHGGEWSTLTDDDVMWIHGRQHSELQLGYPFDEVYDLGEINWPARIIGHRMSYRGLYRFTSYLKAHAKQLGRQLKEDSGC